jgi:mxaJ protein
MLYGDYAKPDPPADIIRAVADRDIDVALVWGPLAGYFAWTSPVPLTLGRVTPWLDQAQWPMVYDISVGVRKNDPAFQHRIEAILARRHGEIDRILSDYRVPLVD